jgi:hypothetical protein
MVDNQSLDVDLFFPNIPYMPPLGLKVGASRNIFDLYSMSL